MGIEDIERLKRMTKEQIIQALREGPTEEFYGLLNIACQFGEITLDISGANLPGLKLTDTSGYQDWMMLQDVNMTGINLQGASLMHLAMASVMAAGANFKEANLTDAHIMGGNFDEADFSHALLDAANICEEYELSLVGANFTSASLRGIEAEEVNFVGATLAKNDFFGSQLYGVRIDGAPGCRFDQADLTDSTLFGNLEGTSFRQAVLPDSNLFEANLRGSRFPGSRP